MSQQKPIIILGAGATGLSAAYRLAELEKEFIIIEKADYLGGLATTLNYQGLPYEFGPHAFHLKNPQIVAWIKKLLGRDFRVIATNTKILINNRLFDYPLNAAELIRKINLLLALRIIFEYLFAYIKKIIKKKPTSSFEEWGLENFGKTLYKLSFGDYTQKVWGMSPRKLSALLATNKLSRLNLGDIILKLMGFRGKNQPLFFKKYLYPKAGAGVIFEKMRLKIANKGQILTSCRITRLKRKNNQITTVEFLDKKGKKRQIECKAIISTINLNHLISLIRPAPEGFGKKLDLSYRGLIIIYLVIKNKNLPDAQWIYLAENKFLCNRLTIGKNLSPEAVKKGKTILAFELSSTKGDKLWKATDAQLEEIALKDLKKLNLGEMEIIDFFIRRLDNAYPIYLLNYEKKLAASLEKLSQIKNLISTGRNGLFLNSDISDSMEMGFQAAEKITK